MATQAVTVQWFKMTDDQKRKDMWDSLGKRKANLANLLPAGVGPERMLLTAFNSLNKNPKLLKCTKDSILLSIIRAFELGLEPDTPEQLSHLIPFGEECKLMVGYRGMLKLAGEQKGVAFIDANLVYDNDVFEIDLGVDQKLIHKPHLGADRGKMRLVYSVVRYIDGRIPKIDYMLKDEVEKVRAASRGKDSDAWVKWETEMWKKTMLKRACRTLTGNERLSKAIEVDNEFDSGDRAMLEGGAKEIFSSAMVGQAGDPNASASDRLASKLSPKEQEEQDSLPFDGEPIES